MYSSEDLERFYFQYQTEAVPHGVSLQSFCSTHNVPYNLFHKWYKDTRRKIVEVQVDGVPPVPPSDSVPSSPSVENPVKKDIHLRGFTDMRCKHSRVLSVIREQLHREPSDGDIYIVMSKDRRIVRLFAYDNCSYSLFEKKFVSGYQFMRIIKDDEGNEVAYRIDWKDVVLLLENPVIKSLKIR